MQRAMVYEYHAVVERVIDGDTVVMRLDLGYRMAKHAERVRVLDVDTAEMRPRAGPQYEEALRHTAFTSEWLAEATVVFGEAVAAGEITTATEWPLTVRSHERQRDGFGRTLGSIQRRTDGESLGEALVAAFGEAVRYTR